MLTTTNAKKYYKGSGAVMLQLEDSDGDLLPGMIALGNAPGFGMTMNVTKETIRNFTIAAQPIDAEPVQERDEEYSIKFKELNLDTIRMLWMAADATAITQVAGTGGTHTTEDVVLGQYYNLGKRSISTVTAAVGAVPLVAGIDFEVWDAALGIVHLLPGATAVEDGDDVVWTFDSAAITAPGLAALNTSAKDSVRCRLFFLGDPARGDTYDLTVWRAEVSPDGEVPLIGNQTAEFGIKVKAVSDPEHPEGLSYIVRRKAA